MNDTELRDLLHDLPRATASSRFTSSVVRELSRPSAKQRAPWFSWRVAAAFAVTVCLVVGLHAAMLNRAREQRLRVLRAEHQRIEAELAAVRKAAHEVEPVMILESGDGTRVVVDYSQEPAATPASLQYD